jgi:hypothetical protein
MSEQAGVPVETTGGNQLSRKPEALVVRYLEDFTTSSAGCSHIAGPGVLEVTDGVFKHTSVGSSVWCE